MDRDTERDKEKDKDTANDKDTDTYRGKDRDKVNCGNQRRRKIYKSVLVFQGNLVYNIHKIIVEWSRNYPLGSFISYFVQL
jgi:hypothetical protein